ncbi:flavodoxin family protein [Marinagarivorans cellulosilyticus]|uniref:NADPH-dependent FMN reductase-like domain-containing protein n=1 Tax=Marinagarivorans cellulosilyticus TaxID=2721545 RepID=A0AAN1WG81_9GAMM|nr:flavodoxin family protein [Marinagarivorans cellulosilyticus]BCD97029.1 hypothetical protein MARGE09_P1229 [Marinagarivorans cellulosilyticus]
MKIFAISGSPNREGNTCTYGNHVIEAAKKNGAEVEEVNIYDFNITDVWENYFGDALFNKFEKAGSDDMPLLKDKMMSADIILLITPIYWCQMTGKMKTFVDRWTDTINLDFSSDLGGKGLALVSTHSGMNQMNSSNVLQTAMDNTAVFLGMTWLGGIDGASKMEITSGMNEGHEIIAKDFGAKLARGENLLGMKVVGGE